jgi:hypothetical protein
MGDKLDPNRFGELWNPLRLQVIERELLAIQPYVVLSGGWAWHFLTPPGHVEYKHAHDHKDADVFVAPPLVAPLMALLAARGYERTWARFDRLPSDVDFNRYTRVVDDHSEPVKVMLDLFVADVPHVEASGFRVVEPSFLLSQYGVRHSSDQCFAVRIARELVARGEDVAGHPELGQYERFL